MSRVVIETVGKVIKYTDGQGERCELQIIKTFRNGETVAFSLYCGKTQIDLGYENIVKEGEESLAVQLAEALYEIDDEMPSKVIKPNEQGGQS